MEAGGRERHQAGSVHRPLSPPRPVTTTDNVHQVNDQGTVYVVQAGEHFKIGWTTSLEARINALRTGSPLPLRLIGTCSGGRDLEREWHKEFEPYCTNGEWFRLTEQHLEDLARRLDDGPRDLPPLRHRRYERGSVHPLLQVRVDVETRDAILASGTSTADFLREAVQEKLAGA